LGLLCFDSLCRLDLFCLLLFLLCCVIILLSVHGVANECGKTTEMRGNLTATPGGHPAVTESSFKLN